VRDRQNLYGVTTVLIEDKASGTQLIQELIADGCHGVTRYQPTTDKIMRMHAQTAMIENGFVSIPQSAPWLAEYLHEMTVFPNGKHDDQVDSTAQFLEWFQKPFPGQNIYELYRREDEKLKHQRESEKRKPPRPVNVRVKAPPGRTTRAEPVVCMTCMGLFRFRGRQAKSRRMRYGFFPLDIWV
jgi:predicted phage terminase large subunit-like protein